MHGDLFWSTANNAPRPVLVVQADLFDGAPTVIVLPVTIKQPLAGWPFNAAVDADSAGLDRPAWVRVTQPCSVARADLGERIGTLAEGTLEEVLAAMALLLGIPSDLPPPAVRGIARSTARH